ncbi:hypothetical protein GWR56_12350 [Mucilaginibacter sp. 14171R-50]|uniref:hypothetical protein n=1 Tax=Mucilaginibacter sp. 14171R-50 TaxID=2703789 RepID=UPI00138BAD5F|nr:hypothetical protein [Mucilaginibacter sp. 14171R-50]QHS56288.1 hypothetical protein GWR56_12350 [Mucilaginibacter sp. 14171R-50]
MRTSLNNIKAIDDHLLGLAAPPDNLLFEAKMILNPELRADVYWHQQTLALVQQYGREQLRAEIEAVHKQLFTRPEHHGFRQSILRFFKR